MKIGILGGTFDPIHKGHLMLGEYAYRQFKLDLIWFMPNGNPPHKSNDSIESQTTNRVEMVKRAISQTEYFSLQPYEVENQGVHYSYKTMEYFEKMYPEHEFYFIIGADSLFSIEKWVHPEILLKKCVILAAYRDEKGTEEMVRQINYLNQKYCADIRLLNTPYVDISSSEIREMLKVGQSIRGIVPDSVCAYIEENQLYRD
jgi:nicotinate-nucleotide adenylyltransferase